MAAVEGLVSQSRALSDEEFAAHCRQTMTCIASGKRGQDCLFVLREFYRYLACRKKRRTISDELIKQLKGMIIETGKCPTKMRLLAMLILRELSPTVGYSIKMSAISADINWLPLLFPLIFAQGEELGHIALHIPQFVRWVKSLPGSNASLQRNSLLCLHLIQYYYGSHLFTEDKVNEISSQMVQWLGNASTDSAPNPYQRKLFTPSKTKFQPVSELDGSACHSFYTVLNLAQYCFPDQFLNMHTFSVLRQWLYDTWSMQEGLGDISFDFTPSKAHENLESPFESVSFSEQSFFEERMMSTPGVEDDYDKISDMSLPSNSPSLNDITHVFAAGDSGRSTPAASEQRQRDEDNVSVGGESNLSSMKQVFGSESSFFSEGGHDGTLARKAMSYCYRLLKQSERKTSTLQDAILVKACIVEAVSLLDFFCAQEKALIPKAIQAVRRIYKVVKVWPSPWTDALLPMVLFFINHGEAIILDSEPYCKFFFGDVLVNSFSSPEFAFETVTFCLENLEKLCQSTTIFFQFFPNLFKILAWFPRTFLKEFLEFLPAMISEKTSVEVFHFLLDLPCLAAALETIKHARKQGNSTGDSSLRKSIAAYHDPHYKPIFAFILRQKGGIADTIDKIDVLHSVFEDGAEIPRVLVCSQVAWLMLKIYFKTVLKDESAIAAGKLLPVILERVTIILSIEGYKKNVQNLLADEILVMFKHHPSLVVDHLHELIEFVSGMKSLEPGFENFFTNLIWIIGEYVSSKYDQRCGNQLIIQYHEAIESVTYELALTMNVENSQDICSPRLISVLMSTLAKLASRCQDLIPKVILCISKVSKLRSELCLDLAEKEALLIRATELISLLKLPNIAPLILSPDPSQETGRLHHDRHTSLPFFLETAKDMLLK